MWVPNIEAFAYALVAASAPVAVIVATLKARKFASAVERGEEDEWDDADFSSVAQWLGLRGV